jgi:N-acyl-L-homoserine lactone synthetase
MPEAMTAQAASTFPGAARPLARPVARPRLDRPLSLLHTLGLFLFDRAAERAGYTFERAVSVEDRDAAFRIRWQVYTERGYIDRADHPDGRFIDPYDDHSILFLARQHGRPVGTARLIPAAGGTQVLDQYNLELPPAVTLGRAAEIGRFAVAMEHRGGRRLAAIGLFRAAFSHSLLAGVRWWFGNTTPGFLRSMAIFGDAISHPAEGPLEAHHLEARQILSGYFEQMEDRIELFLVDLNRVAPSPARIAGLVRRRPIGLRRPGGTLVENLP